MTIFDVTQSFIDLFKNTKANAFEFGIKLLTKFKPKTKILEPGYVRDIDGQLLVKTTIDNGYSTLIIHTNSSGQTHRVGGPASYGNASPDQWFLDGKQHRIGGPALEWPSHLAGIGNNLYYVDGIQYKEEEYPQAVFKYKLKQLIN